LYLEINHYISLPKYIGRYDEVANDIIFAASCRYILAIFTYKSATWCLDGMFRNPRCKIFVNGAQPGTALQLHQVVCNSPR